MNELTKTSDGSHTIYVPELNEHYHSIHGAVQESSIVYIQNGLGFSKECPVNVFEVGFGTGLNTLLSVVYSSEHKLRINYTTIEKYPMPLSVIKTLNHWSFAGKKGKQIFEKIHRSKWGTSEKITGNFSLKKIEGDFVSDKIEGKYNLIYFDAFGPDKQPGIWTKSVFEKISEMTVNRGVLVTYSAKGEVKRLLRSNGFEVELLMGPPGKREMIRATKL
jgi:tRNA U34 5-methylaminomethyl-2-thiouridine-forming methyltransferase MnmC